MSGQATTPQLKRLEKELGGLRLQHHGLAVAERGNLSAIAGVLRRMRALELPPRHPDYGSPLIPDVSEYQPGISWRSVAGRGVKRALVKATQYRTDYQFERNWRGMLEAGFVGRGAYHYFTEHPGVDQARQLLDAVAAAGGLKLPYHWDPQHGPVGDWLTVDFEQAYGGYAETRAELEALVHELHRQVGYRVMLYTGGPFWNSATAGWQNDLNCILHHAAYVTNEASYLPTCWHPALGRLWQYTDGKNGRQPHEVGGIGSCDISVTVPGR